MIAHRFRLMIVASLCGLACALAVWVSPAAAATQVGGPGTGSGQFRESSGVGIDQATGDVYVPDMYNYRVDEFDGSGNFLMAWGWGVDEADPADEPQTCTTSCRGGISGPGAGQFAGEGPQGAAVDNDPLSESDGDVYVVDWESFRVEKFSSSGKFLLMFGGGVNEATNGDVCVAGERCQQGTEGTSDGQFEWAYRGDGYIAVGPGGAVYVGDHARIEVFEPSGVWRENISLSSLSSTGKVTALAVDSVGDMYVKDSEVPGVREIEPTGVEKSTQFDAGSESVQSIALDEESDDLFVGDSSGGFHILEYDPTGKEIDSFGSRTAESTNGMAFSDTRSELYVSNPSGSNLWILPAPESGPLVEPGSESATPGRRGTATLEASVNPEGNETTYRFEYIDEAHYKESGYASASSTPAVSIGSSFEDQSASAHLSGLIAGGTYHYRVVATNSEGTATGPDETLTTVAPVLIEGPWVSGVAGTSVTLSARIDPLGAATEYRLEYGTSTAYGHTLSGKVGEGEGYVLISYHQQELQPLTTYHYRLVTSNEVGSVESSDQTFTTQPAGGELALPDGRAWQLVSPPDKGGSLIDTSTPYGNDLVQAASDGSGITYQVTEPIGEGVVGYSYWAQILSMHGASGWTSRDVNGQQSLPSGGEPAGTALIESGEHYELFSTDLSSALLEPGHTGTTPLSAQATERTLYLRDDINGTFSPLETEANVQPGTKFGDPYMEYQAATPDLSHVVFSTFAALKPETVKGDSSLYEWHAGELQLVSILPDGKATSGGAIGSFTGGGGMSARAISDDGRWVVWKHGESEGGEGLYVRDMVAGRTMQIGGRHARFETMSSDGSKIFFVEQEGNSEQESDENGDLYMFDTADGMQTNLTASQEAGERSADVQDAVMGASEDGSYIYFVARGVLASGAVRGEDNLYVLHESGGSWTTTHIATLSPEDQHSWGGGFTAFGASLSLVSSRVSPDGHYVAFMSDRSLTGYDNIDAVSGKPDEEVYLYNAVTDRLVCVSCDPTGARPVGVYDTSEGTGSLLVDRLGAWTATHGAENHWLAGSIPGWSNVEGRALYQPRYLSDSGRLFFDSPDALVPQDTNGLEDVYEYEPVGIGSCTEADVTFGQRSDGCVGLISSGQSSSESAFLDASETGDDVFFVTASRLTTEDYDTSSDIYDAHVCSTSSPCMSSPVSPPPCASGDSCKAAPSPQPEVFGPAASATFSGAGNIVEDTKPSAIKPKAKHKPKRHVRRNRHKVKRTGKSGAGRAGRKGKR
jgi:hypothetical protein